ncbi:hypothetical protein ZIOFF_004093 [Zingiber officinale]|uniref:Core-2/I-branching beta-1,6-N-acetylglucosaminyltransferase family protein n=1 Tax=Zingiber officinale TaxID=94328 RepID=A0A8J5I7I9_ZINOF|nr:hypothetical protein ZIOFF_004093 [Zingiber officinale]
MKRRSFLPQHRSGRWRIKLLLMVLLLFSCFCLLMLNHYSFSRVFEHSAAEAPPVVDTQKPKIAFLFIARNRLPLEFVWDAFFQVFFFFFFPFYFSYFVQLPVPSILFLPHTFFSDSVIVEWGEASMIEAERILLRNAIKDSFNERFLFLSDSCIPLYNFSYIYKYIMSTTTSFIDRCYLVTTLSSLDLFADTKEGRYNPRMNPVIPVYNWRKGSQWVVLTRKHAQVMINDDAVLPEFERHCRRKSLPEFWRDHPFPADPSKEHNCIPDEHYVQTLIAEVRRQGAEPQMLESEFGVGGLGEVKYDRARATVRAWRVAKGRRGCEWRSLGEKDEDEGGKSNLEWGGPVTFEGGLTAQEMATEEYAIWFGGARSGGGGERRGDVATRHFCCYPTLTQKGLEGEITRRALTHTLWDLSSSKDRQRRGWHPVTYKLSDATPKLINDIKACDIQGIDNIYYETEYRREWCRSQGMPSKCFLFARKFTRAAVMGLLNSSVLIIN